MSDNKITSEKILTLPGISEHFATASNGGTKCFHNSVKQKGYQTWLEIEYNGDNWHFEKTNNPRFHEIKITKYVYDPSLGDKFDDRISELELFKGIVTDMKELESLYNQYK